MSDTVGKPREASFDAMNKKARAEHKEQKEFRAEVIALLREIRDTLLVLQTGL